MSLVFNVCFGRSGGSSSNPAGYTYTGDSEFIDEGNGNFMLKLLSSGTLTINKLNSLKNGADLLLVAGGKTGILHTGGKGGGVNAVSNKTVDKGSYNIVIGQTNENTTAFGETAVSGEGSATTTDGVDPWGIGTKFGAGGGFATYTAQTLVEFNVATGPRYTTSTVYGKAHGSDVGDNTGAGGDDAGVGYSGIVIIRNKR